MDISNGESIGVALFVQGCRFHCYNCFNPSTWDFNGGKEWTKEVKNKFLELANRPYIKRISILGGEPLTEENLDDVLDLVNEIHLSLPNKIIWIYSGYTWEQLFKEDKFGTKEENLNNKKRREIITLSDIFVDGRYIDSQRDITLKWRGSTNQRVINVKKSLENDYKMILWEN